MMGQQPDKNFCEDIFELLCTVLQHTTRDVVWNCSLAGVALGEGSLHAGCIQAQGLVVGRGVLLWGRAVCFGPGKEAVEVITQRGVAVNGL